jgi:hypothetical protein
MLNAYYAWKSNGEDKKWTYDNFLNLRSLQSGDNVRQQVALKHANPERLNSKECLNPMPETLNPKP